jgi:hypothetical protein
VEIELYSISPLTIDRTGQHHAMCGSRPGKEPLKHLTEDGQAPIRYRLFGRKNPFCRESGHDSSVFCAVACSIYQQRRTGCLSSRQTALNILLSIFHHTKYQQVQETPATCLWLFSWRYVATRTEIDRRALGKKGLQPCLKDCWNIHEKLQEGSQIVQSV